MTVGDADTPWHPQFVRAVTLGVQQFTGDSDFVDLLAYEVFWPFFAALWILRGALQVERFKACIFEQLAPCSFPSWRG